MSLLKKARKRVALNAADGLAGNMKAARSKRKRARSKRGAPGAHFRKQCWLRKRRRALEKAGRKAARR